MKAKYVMKNQEHPSAQELMKYFQVETLSAEDIHQRGLDIVSATILPHIARKELVRAEPFTFLGLDNDNIYRATAVLYSGEKDVTTNVMVDLELLDLKEKGELDERIAYRGLLGVVKQSMSPRNMVMTVNAEFFKGKHEPSKGGLYGEWDYFSTGGETPMKVGELRVSLNTNSRSEIEARLGSESEPGADISIGTLDTMAIWLRDASELPQEW